MIEQAFIRIMLISIGQQCVAFKNKQDKKDFDANIIGVLKDLPFDDNSIKRARNIWLRRCRDLTGLNASMMLLVLYHFIDLSEIKIDDQSSLQKVFEELSQYIPESYFPKTERQTDNMKWLEAKGKARMLLHKLRKVHEIFI